MAGLETQLNRSSIYMSLTKAPVMVRITSQTTFYRAHLRLPRPPTALLCRPLDHLSVGRIHRRPLLRTLQRASPPCNRIVVNLRYGSAGDGEDGPTDFEFGHAVPKAFLTTLFSNPQVLALMLLPSF